jgi:cobalt/nickel transport system permease protein
MKDVQVPQWLLQEERITPPKDRDAFIRKSAAALTYVLTKARRIDERQRSRIAFSTQIKLALTLLFVLLVAASRNFAFVEIVGVALLVLLATYEQEKLARVLILPIQALIISLIILAPSLLLGQTRAFVVVPCKTFLTTTAISLLAYSTSRNRFTCAFKSFGAPDSALFIFDLTLKYVVVLGEICLETLEAVRLRSVGRNRRKAQTLGGIVGVAFLRAQKSAQEQFDAMTCRCFSGKYRRFKAPMRKIDLLGVALCLGLLSLFIYLEIAIRCSN